MQGPTPPAPTPQAPPYRRRVRRVDGRSAAPSLCEPQGESRARGSVARRLARVGEARAETARGRRPVVRDRAAARAAHSDPRTTVRPTRTTGSPNRDARHEPARAPAVAVERTAA